MNGRIAFLIHGSADSVEAVRARGLSRQWPSDRVHFLWRERSRVETARAWHRAIRELAPDLLYVVNAASPGSGLACWWRLAHRLPFVLDTGDAVYEMAARAGTVPRWRLPVLRLAEALSQRLADTVVVRGTRHREWLRARGYRRVRMIRDGCTPAAAPPDAVVQALKAKLGLTGQFVVGVMGSLVYSPRLKICYGWDLVQALPRLRELPVRGLVIGDGPGRSWLEAHARRHEVLERLVFCGRIPYDAVPVYLRLMDVALSTQTNNLPGQVRTTGKLPEYAAAERFILASRVGEAALLLPDEMLLDYEGEVDPGYPRRLAERVRWLYEEPGRLQARAGLRRLVQEHFTYEVLSRQFAEMAAAVRLR
ncbi:MAG: glycosyltransferase [Verrucomicrobia bacterium]|nr:glycosyltransferase [Verrucomicrobiota bacterium]